MKVDDTGNEMHSMDAREFLDRHKLANLKSRVNVFELALHHLYTNCPVTPTGALRRNPHMLGDDDNKCWIRADSVFRILALYGFDEAYLNRLAERFDEGDGDG